MDTWHPTMQMGSNENAASERQTSKEAYRQHGDGTMNTGVEASGLVISMTVIAIVVTLFIPHIPLFQKALGFPGWISLLRTLFS